jgi:protein ImuB
VLAEVAREFSPRIEVCSATEIVLDLGGLERLFGDARTIAEELRRTAADRGLRVRVAIAGTRTAARLLVRSRAGLTIVEPGNEAAAVAPLPVASLGDLSTTDQADLIATFHRWGLRTLGDLAALPADDLAARIGRHETEWQRLARGEDPRPLVPAVPEERFEQSLDLEWPIEELEPLAFVLGRLMEQLETHLERRDRGAAVLHVRLHLIKTDGTTREVHERSLQLPVAIRDARTLRTLALLDLESNPPPAAIDRVTVAVDPTPGRIVQFSLLTRPLPSPEQISTLMARLHALMGETRCGSPVTVDSWEPGAFAMKPFLPPDVNALHMRNDTQRHRDTEARTSRVVEAKDASNLPVVALRRFRHPLPIRVHVKQGKPSTLSIFKRGLSGGAVNASAGPWRTSGGWWESGRLEPGARRLKPWDRDEWDVALADGPAYRLFRERHTDEWFLEGVVD